jgi:protein required for attachment to host cells
MTNLHWIVVANGARAAFYSRDPEDEAFRLNLEQQFAHPEGRSKGEELVSDRPGAVRGHGSDSAQYVPHLDPKRNEMEHFGRQLAFELDRLHRAGRLERLTLVASNPFLGVLRSHLPDALRDAVELVAHDYTTLADRELRQRLAELAVQTR